MADVVVWQFLLIAASSIGSGGSLSSGGSLKEKEKHYKLFWSIFLQVTYDGLDFWKCLGMKTPDIKAK